MIKEPLSAFGKGTQLSGVLCLWQCFVLKVTKIRKKRLPLKTFHLETNLCTVPSG